MATEGILEAKQAVRVVEKQDGTLAPVGRDLGPLAPLISAGVRAAELGGRGSGELQESGQGVHIAQTAPQAFHDITAGSNVVPCLIGTPDCVSGTFGYSAGPGYDRTGLTSWPCGTALPPNFDVFNVFNNQGLNPPAGDGIASLANSYGTFGFRPRQVHVTMRLEW